MQGSKSRKIEYTFAVILLAAAVMVGCSDETSTEEPEEVASTPQVTQRQAPTRRAPAQPVRESAPAADEDFRVMPTLDGALEEDGMGLDVIIDASSKSAYVDSLEWISQDASKEQFSTLENSIRYIHMYDSEVFGNEERLRNVVDGMTGHEIVARAEQLMKERRRQN